MPVCLEEALNVNGTRVSSPSIVYTPMDPQPADFSTCSFVIQSGAEVTLSPFVLTTEQGAQIGGAILGLWAIAWVIRQFAGLLISSTHPLDKE